MQAVTAWYYTPGVGASTGKPKANLVNYVETAASTFAVQQIGSTALLPSTKLLLIAQGPDVYVADLACPLRATIRRNWTEPGPRWVRQGQTAPLQTSPIVSCATTA